MGRNQTASSPKKEKNFYIQKYNVILFVGGDFDWPRRRTTLMAAKPTFHVVRGLPWGRHYIANIRDPSQCPLHSDNCFKRPRLHFLGYGLHQPPVTTIFYCSGERAAFFGIWDILQFSTLWNSKFQLPTQAHKNRDNSDNTNFTYTFYPCISRHSIWA